MRYIWCDVSDTDIINLHLCRRCSNILSAELEHLRKCNYERLAATRHIWYCAISFRSHQKKCYWIIDWWFASLVIHLFVLALCVRSIIYSVRELFFANNSWQLIATKDKWIKIPVLEVPAILQSINELVLNIYTALVVVTIDTLLGILYIYI
jgi:hypothetical protein